MQAVLLQSGQTSIVSAADAVAALNGSPLKVTVEGHQPPQSGGFVADIALFIEAAPSPPPPPSPTTLVGKIAPGTSATQNGFGGIDF